jgi:hypothetical protein
MGKPKRLGAAFCGGDKFFGESVFDQVMKVSVKAPVFPGSVFDRFKPPKPIVNRPRLVGFGWVVRVYVDTFVKVPGVSDGFGFVVPAICAVKAENLDAINDFFGPVNSQRLIVCDRFQ